MKNATRTLLLAFTSQVALLSGVPDATSKFTVEPSVQQRLEARIQESSEFLSRINMAPVDELKGERLGLGVTGTIAGRTNTSAAGRRSGVDPTGLDEFGYECVQTNFDVALRYSKLDMWAKFDDFETKIRDLILKRQALDRILIGFNGTSAAATTDRVANSLLQDVNIGWLEKIRTQAPAHHLAEVVAESDQVTYGDGGDYKTLDALVWDAKESLLAEWAKGDTELVVICSGDLLNDKYFPLINADRDPSEQIARDIIMSTKRLGNLPAYQVPGFPSGTVLITRLDNLSIYYQDGKRRRHIKDEPEADQVTDYQSSNEAYVVEDFDGVALVENITAV